MTIMQKVVMAHPNIDLELELDRVLVLSDLVISYSWRMIIHRNEWPRARQSLSSYSWLCTLYIYRTFYLETNLVSLMNPFLFHVILEQWATILSKQWLQLYIHWIRVKLTEEWKKRKIILFRSQFHHLWYFFLLIKTIWTTHTWFVSIQQHCYHWCLKHVWNLPAQ